MLKEISQDQEYGRKELKAFREGQQSERLRIAQDIHDGVGPLLASLTLYTQALEDDLRTRAPEIGKRAKVIGRLAVRIASDLRNIAQGLVSQDFAQRGLVASLRKYCRELNAVSEADVHLAADEALGPVDGNLAYAIYCIALELINNANKHGEATTIGATLKQYNDKILLTVKDDGQGIEEREIEGPAIAGIGWRNIARRIEALQGTYTIDSEPAKGSIVAIEFPRK